MGIHTCIYNGSIGTTLAAVAAVSDGVLGSRSSNLIPSTDMWLFAAAAFATTLVRARISTPTTIVSPVYIRPSNGTEWPTTNPNMLVMPQNPVMMRRAEEITVEAEAGGANKPFSAVLWLADQLEPTPAGESFWVRFTATGITTVAGAWSTLSSLVYEKSSLPAGRYAILGMEIFSTSAPTAGAICARLILPGAVLRPGTLCLSTAGDKSPLMVSDNSLGVWGRFDALLPPSIEVYCRGAEPNVAFEGYLRIVKIG